MKRLASHLTHTFPRWKVLILAAVVATVGMAMCCSSALAQSGAGSIQGTVTDATGAVIQGASIHVVNQATAVAANTKSNNVGFYSVPGLFTGTYSVTVTAPGMKTYSTLIELLVAQTAVINPVMTAGAVTQRIDVTADMVQLTTTGSGVIASTLENSRINQLPLNGRLLLSLASETTPGIVNGQRNNGLMREALEYVQDGAPLSNRQFGGGGGGINQVMDPDPDAVQEVSVETMNAGAQNATPGTVIITTKSGTNGLHGSFFETARNNAVGIAKARQNPSNYSAPHLVRNEFGASAGGPIVIPHVYHGKDKSFWFFAYERYSLVQTVTERVTVPTQAMRQGDFSGLYNRANQLQQIYDPATTGSSLCNTGQTYGQYCRLPFANNQIPINRLAPATKILYDITPLPTTTDNPLVTSNFIAPNPTVTIVPTTSFRFDHSFNESNKAYLRYTDNIMTTQSLRNYPANSPETIAADGFPLGASGYQDTPSASFSGALGFTHVFSPTFFAETVLSQQWLTENVEGGGNPSLNYESMLGLPNNFGQSGFPNIGANLIMPYGGTQFNYLENQIITNLDENLSKTMGKHQLQFGGRYRHERFGYLVDRLNDAITFGALATGLENPASGATYSGTPNTGYQDADFFLGAAANYSEWLQPPYIHFHDMEFDAYFQDDYRVSRNLTLNIGLRYEAHPSEWTKDGMTESFDLKNDAQVLEYPTSYYVAKGYTTQAVLTNLANLGVVFETPQQAGYPSTMQRNYDLNFNPRIGLAYQPFGGKYGTVIRGGYGRYIYPLPVRANIKPTVTNAPFVANYIQSYTAANQSPDGLQNYLLRAAQTVVMGQNSSGVVNSTATNAILPGFNIFNLAPNQAPDMVTSTNLTVEQPFKGNSALRVSWVWVHGTHLDHPYLYNATPSTYVWEMATGTTPPTGTYSTVAMNPYDQTKYGGSSNWNAKDGFSNDNGLQVNYQRLFHHGSAYQVLYVWSKPLRFGGDFQNPANIYPTQNYVGNTGAVGTMTSPYGTVIAPALPPARPAGIPSYANYHALDKYEAYTLDTVIPKHLIEFNGVLDLPVGRGKRFLGNSNRLVDELVGGFQIAGDGNIASQDFQLANGNWGPTNPLKTYKHNAPITDCRSGTCYKEFEWFNGYIAPTATTSCTNGKCVTGLPSNWVPNTSPIDTTVGTANYNTNNVQVQLLNGQTTTVAYSPGPLGANPYSKSFLNGPINYTIDLSVFKVFPITEKTNLRFNVDAFNALNMQGYNNPSTSDGTENMLSSYNTPRQLQFTARFTF